MLGMPFIIEQELFAKIVSHAKSDMFSTNSIYGIKFLYTKTTTTYVVKWKLHWFVYTLRWILKFAVIPYLINCVCTVTGNYGLHWLIMHSSV